MKQRDAEEVIRNNRPDCSREEIRRAWQTVVDNGTVWKMGKWYADMATCLISSGVIERNAA